MLQHHLRDAMFLDSALMRCIAIAIMWIIKILGYSLNDERSMISLPLVDYLLNETDLFSREILPTFFQCEIPEQRNTYEYILQ